MTASGEFRSLETQPSNVCYEDLAEMRSLLLPSTQLR